MTTWVTVWVLTVFTGSGYFGYYRPSNFQLQYATYEICEKQRQAHLKRGVDSARCDFQQIPVVNK
ncbi:hypothetical protein EXE10_21135 [Acinetobacter sp. WCHAc060033]|uniref:hypothetical protein n=1 Tax=Acinetobacter sp. WCHAc060033 TaxID=2518624 RepID=UPI001023C237|nr:hypothetical protein [Acinetobacter sp. WCHAc060033]RZG71978.1 hypothetical protein EXE10_21135 [Acinetobacter sp. WCHAc060033]